MSELSGAVAQVRDCIARARANPLLQAVPGLADDLHSIGEAFGALDLVVRVLTRAYLAGRYGYELSPVEYRYLRQLSGEVSPTYLVDVRDVVER